MELSTWRYPLLFAHRGGGTLAPENTMAAMAKAVEHGFGAVEFDVKLSRDGVAILLHDDTLERTTDGSGPAALLDYAQLARLDAGRWFGRAFAGEPVPAFAAVAGFCRCHGLAANVEIKPCPGREQETGAAVARAALELWDGAPLAPLLSSFSYEALLAARQAAPALPLGWLIEAWPEDWPARLAALGAVSLHCDEALLTPERVSALQAAGYRVLAYTVNAPERARALIGWGVDGLFTDALDTLPAEL